MLDDLIAAFDRQDYRTAAQLVKELLKQTPNHPWGQLYWGRLQEVSGKLETAEKVYRQLLRETTIPKLAMQARQGIQRIDRMQQERRQQAIAAATSDPTSSEQGFLALEGVVGEARNGAIQALTRVMNIEPYTARLLLPSKSWRLYRHGPIGELQWYGQSLRQAGVPACWAAVPDIQKIQVFQVKYIQAVTPQATVVCQNDQGQLGSLNFAWSEVSQRVEGMLPLFGQVVDLGYRDQLQWKEQTQDYTHFCDLHLPDRRCILRIHEGSYDFDQGIVVARQANHLDRNTIRTNWNALLQQLSHCSPGATIWSDFTGFGETASDFSLPLFSLKSHIRLPRATDTYLDAAFHLYSSLIFLRQNIVGNSAA